MHRPAWNFPRASNFARALLYVTAISLVLGGCGAELDVAPVRSDAATIEQQAQTFVAAMKPRREGRPVIAVVAINDATEMTDFMLTHAALQRADVADVQAIATRRGLVTLYPAFRVEVAQDLAGFDQTHPTGADYVIVPAISNPADPALAAWLQRQANLGARIIGICAGALVLGNAGLLDGRRFATHWYYRREALEKHPAAEYVPHQRYLADRDVATTTGITASVPTMIALVEAIAGREKAEALAVELGVNSWTPAHDSSRFALGPKRALNYVLTRMAFWRNEQWNVDVRDGMDDIALALVADAWSRTGLVSVEAIAPNAVKLRSGLWLAAHSPGQRAAQMPLSSQLKPTQQLDRTLCEIRQRFGAAAVERVMMELEYARSPLNCAD